MTTAIIPARGGSKGLPRKNLRRLCGQTLLARCIGTCQAAGLDVVVSTEDAAIAAEAVRCKARVHTRPESLAQDDSTTWDVVRDAIDSPDLAPIVIAQCTAPFMTPGDIRNALVKLHECDIAVVCHESHALLLDEHGEPLNWSTDQTLRQERGRQFEMAGSVWATRPDYLLFCGEYDGTVGVVVAENPVKCDIDTESDLHFAEQLLTDRTSGATFEVSGEITPMRYIMD